MMNPMLLLLRGLIVLLLIVPLQASAQDAAPELPEKENFHLFLLVGQSNMAGRGKLAESDRQPPERVLTFSKDQKWVPAIDPIHFDKPKAAGVGLGRTFGIEIAQATPGATIGLIPCAVGGTPIEKWVPGGYDPHTKTHPWDDALIRAKKALESGQLKGILWHQGEGDGNAQRAPHYEKNLTELIARFRKELDAPHVPFIIGQLGKFEARPWDDFKRQVDAAQQNVARSVPNCAFVPAAGLTDKGDGVHFSAEAYRELGKRYAQAYLEMIGP